MLRVPTILVTGPVGVGKTTLIGEMGMVLADAGIPHATVDFDQLTATFPRGADDDGWGTKIGLANLKAIWRNYKRGGAERLLIARVIGSRDELAGFRAAVPGAEITVVRLRAPVRTLQARVRRRGPGGDMKWHVARAAELAPLMDKWQVQDMIVETEGSTPQALALEILSNLGWIEKRPLRR